MAKLLSKIAFVGTLGLSLLAGCDKEPYTQNASNKPETNLTPSGRYEFTDFGEIYDVTGKGSGFSVKQVREYDIDGDGKKDLIINTGVKIILLKNNIKKDTKVETE